jgi:hypothetical protein
LAVLPTSGYARYSDNSYIAVTIAWTHTGIFVGADLSVNTYTGISTGGTHTPQPLTGTVTIQSVTATFVGYFANSAGTTPLATAVYVPSGSNQATALAALPTSAYARYSDNSYFAVTIAWTLTGTFAGADGAVNNYTGVATGTGHTTQPLTGTVTIQSATGQTLAQAKTAADASVAALSESNQTTADNILTAVRGAITNSAITATWKDGHAFNRTNATTAATGSIRGTIVLTLGGETVDVVINRTIARLSGGSGGGGSRPLPRPPATTPSHSFYTGFGGSTFTQGSETPLRVTIQKSFSQYRDTRVNGNVLERDRDYRVESGSTVITLLPEFLDNLDAGRHTLSARFTDGAVITATFTVAAKNDDDEPVDQEPIVSPPTRIMLTIGERTYTVNGSARTMDTAPEIISGRTMVPLRFIAEALGAEVDWDNATRTATVVLDGRTVRVTIGELAPGMDVAAMLVNGRTMVPLRFITESLGCDVDWNPDTRTIEIVR